MSDIAKNMVDSSVRANGEAKRYVLCMKWGTKYGADYVNRLYGMVKRHLTLDFTMVCLTDDSRGIDQAVRCYPLPALNLPPNLPERGWNKLTTFAPTLYDLSGTALFLDLDVVIVDNIDALFTYPTRYPDSVLIIRDWKKPWRMVGNSSVYRFQIGQNTYPNLLANFEQNFATIRQQVRHEQAYLSHYLRAHHHLEYFPKDWCVSFKYQCVAPPPLNLVIPPKLPKDAKIVIFHGEVNPPDAIRGGAGKWYRVVRPAPWVAEHWR